MDENLIKNAMKTATGFRFGALKNKNKTKQKTKLSATSMLVTAQCLVGISTLF